MFFLNLVFSYTVAGVSFMDIKSKMLPTAAAVFLNNGFKTTKVQSKFPFSHEKREQGDKLGF